VLIVPGGEVPRAFAVTKRPDQLRGTGVSDAACAPGCREGALDTAANQFSDRHSLFAGGAAEPASLVFRELDLRSNHDQSVITS